MSYKILSLKLRPQKFDDVIGQHHITRTLKNAIHLDRVAHGYLFSGPRGVGKTSTARILAKQLNCQKLINDNPCDSCYNCQEIINGSNLDVQELDGASNRGIDEIRNLREAVKYPPNRAKYRIYIIDEVHMLTREAFNALLKTLEEPPSHVVFIMATTDDHKVPSTILSRTQRFEFKSISKIDISKYLIDILKSQNIIYSEEGISIVAQKADGSMRDALSLLDQVIAYTDNELSLDMIQDVLGIIKENIYLELMQNIEVANNKNVIQLLNTTINGGYSIINFISGFNEFIRDCMLIKSGEKHNLTITQESISYIENCRYSVLDFLRMLELTLKFESKLKFIQQPRISLESLFIKLSMMDSSIDISQLLKNNISNSLLTKSNIKTVAKENTIKGLDGISSEQSKSIKKVSDSNSNNVQKIELTKSNIKTVAKENTIKGSDGVSLEQSKSIKKVSESNSNNVQGTDNMQNLSFKLIKDSWVEIMSILEKNNSKIANFLEEAELSDFNKNILIIDFSEGYEFHIKTLEKDLHVIESTIFQVLKNKIKIKFNIKHSNLKKESHEDSIEEAKDRQNEHPLFMKALEKFNGEIIR